MSEPMEVEHSIDKEIRLEQERLRDELGVRFGWVNVSEENFDALLAPAKQRIFGANGLLRFVADDQNSKKRLWAINVGEAKQPRSLNEKRSCNRHSDCDEADAKVKAKGGFAADHCHDECCDNLNASPSGRWFHYFVEEKQERGQ